MKVNNNRLHNISNPNQGNSKKVLCVCSAGLLRSPTAAVVLSQEPYNFNTRSAGCVEGFALIPVDPILLTWADEIVCMEESHAETIRSKPAYKDLFIKVLNIPDNFAYGDEGLKELIRERYNLQFIGGT